MVASLHNVSLRTRWSLTRRQSRGWRVVSAAAQVPDTAGCYAVYHDGELVYVGSSSYLPTRVAQYFAKRQYRRVHGGARRRDGVAVTVKVAPSVRVGDWLMREFRLIQRLKPCDNRMGVSMKPRQPRRVQRKPCNGCSEGHWDINELIACERRTA